VPISPYPCTWYENRFYKIFLATLIPWPYNLLWIPSIWWYRLYFGLILLLYITLPSRFSWWSSLPYALNPLNKITVPYKKHTNVGGSRLHKLRPTHRRLSLMEADTPHIKQTSHVIIIFSKLKPIIIHKNIITVTTGKRKRWENHIE